MAKQGKSPLPGLPEQRVRRFTEPIARFLHVQAAGGIVLLIAAAVALFMANSQWSEQFLGFWKTQVGFQFGDFEMVHSLKHWINDGLMAIFFFVVGLEVKRELVHGELREFRQAMLPAAAALGGMIVPACVYLAFQNAEPGSRGWGIPMATDIAFVVGCMAVLGSRIPHGLRVLLLSLAIVDDIGAILVIAFGYTDKVHVDFLIYGFALIGVVCIFQRWGVRRIPIYVVLGTLIWFCFHESGIHATIAGVILGLLTPAKSWVGGGLFTKILKSADNVFSGDWSGSESDQRAAIHHLRTASEEAVSPLERLETGLHPWVGFVIMPVFALANAGIPLNLSELGEPISIAIMAGLLLGKPVGIVAATWLVIKVGLSDMPKGVNWGMLTGGGFLAGIGFTMAIFIAELAFKGDPFADSLITAKLGILAASLLAALIGMLLLLATAKSPEGQ